MTFRCNPELRQLLNGHTSKLDWATILNTALTNTRRIRCFRDPNVNSVDPVLTGVEFRNVGSTGALKTTGGAITGLGRIKGSTIKLAANMFSGRSMLRVEGGGHWFDGTLGPTIEAQRAAGVAEANLKQYDFTVPDNFTATNGLGVKPSLAVSGPRFSPSGVGTAAPDLTANAPRYIEIWDYTNPGSPVKASTIDISLRDDNMVLEDAFHQSEIGDVGVYRSEVAAPFYEHELGATLLVADKHNRDDYASNPTEPLYQVIINSAVRQAVWAGYPFKDNWNKDIHSTYLKPHKLVVKTAAGIVLDTIQMHDGSPCNSVKSFYGMRSSTQAVVPNVHAGMVHQWENIRPRISSRANKIYRGMHPDYQRPSVAKHPWTVNGVEPLYNGGYGQNSQDGIQHLYGMPQWPMPRQYYTPAVVDPYLTQDFTRSGAKSEMANNFTGWDYEPGSFSGHNWYTAPGGPRFDRAPIPSAIALMLTFPNGNRLQDNTPWRNIGHSWIKAYGNHGNHWVDDVNMMTLGGPTMKDTINNVRAIGGYYSNGSETYPGKKVIDVRGGMRDDVNPAIHYDYNGQFIWGGWSRDGLHAYGHAGWGGIAENNPMSIVLSKWDTAWTLFTTPGIDESGTNGWFFRENFMVRDHAWMLLSYCLGWRLASKHRLGVDRETIEGLYVRHMTDLNRSIVQPTKNGSQDDFCKSLRSKGQPWAENTTKGGALGCYMAGAMAVMKQTGFWDAMMAKGGKVAETMLFMVECFDRYVYDLLLTSSMRYYPGQFATADDPVGPQGWPTVYAPSDATWAQIFPPGRGALDLVTDRDGTFINLPDVGCHPFLTYPYMRRDYFPEIANARTNDACAVVDALLAKIKAQVDAAPTPADKRGKDLAQGYPGIAPWQPPLQVGPA